MGRNWYQLSREEKEVLKAKGVLLGYTNFNNLAGYYWRASRSGYERIDVNTLEPLTDEDEVIKRQRCQPGDYRYD